MTVLPQLDQLVKNDPPEWLLALDPGGTTGYSLFNKLKMVTAGQKAVAIDELDSFLDSVCAPAIEASAIWASAADAVTVVAEDYRVYPWLLKQHGFSSLETVRLIGAIEHACAQREWPLHLEMAVAAKGFITDDKLAVWGYHRQGLVHACDSMRHALYYIVTRPDLKRATTASRSTTRGQKGEASARTAKRRTVG